MPCCSAELYHFSLWAFVENEPVFYATADCKSITYCLKIMELICVSVPFCLYCGFKEGVIFDDALVFLRAGG